MSYVILGLLHIARMSLYDLMRAFEVGAPLFYGSSTGSIKRSLDKFLAEGAVEVTHQEPGARGRREYGPTSLGRQKFATWVQGEARGNFDVTGVAWIYFLGLVPPADRPPIIARFRECTTTELERLESVERQISGQEAPDTYHDVGRLGQAALYCGLSSTRHIYDWPTASETEVMKHDRTKRGATLRVGRRGRWTGRLRSGFR